MIERGSDAQDARSLLITSLAEEARRRLAAGSYLRRHGIPKLTKAETEALEARVEAEIARARRRRSKNDAA